MENLWKPVKNVALEEEKNHNVNKTRSVNTMQPTAKRIVPPAIKIQRLEVKKSSLTKA